MDVGRPTTSMWCAGQCGDSSWTTDHQKVAGQHYDIGQDDKHQLMKQDKSFDLVKMKYLNFHNVKSLIFTKFGVKD